MNSTTMSRVENSSANIDNILDSNPEVTIGPLTRKKRRRIVVRDSQNENEIVSTIPSIPEWTNEHLYVNGAHTSLACPSYRLLNNLKLRLEHGDHYSTVFNADLQTYHLPETGSSRVQRLLEIRAPNGDVTCTQDHLHWSLLTARPVFWNRLMRLINQACPEMYTPADKPQISSYKFGVPRNPDVGQLKKLFPCLTAYIGEYDGTKNYWQTQCPFCRNYCKYEYKRVTKNFPKTIIWVQETAIPELHARDVAMKWAYLGRRLVYEI